MKLATIWNLARENTTKTSEIVRHLAFAGIALIWVLRPEKTTQVSAHMLPGGVLLIITLVLDLLQHVVTSLNYRQLGKKSKAKLVKEGVPNDEHGERDFAISRHFHLVPSLCFWGKVVTIFAAYGWLLVILVRRFTTQWCHA